jgi:predicted GNAT family acetyltransferase
VGEPGVAARDARNQYALVLFENDEPVAVAGVFLTSGSHEIGVDVVRSKRGRGFGALVVAGAAREITARGGTPLYFCEATNIRSQRTALATGFLPVASQGAVS